MLPIHGNPALSDCRQLPSLFHLLIFWYTAHLPASQSNRMIALSFNNDRFRLWNCFFLVYDFDNLFLAFGACSYQCFSSIALSLDPAYQIKWTASVPVQGQLHRNNIDIVMGLSHPADNFLFDLLHRIGCMDPAVISKSLKGGISFRSPTLSS